MIERLAIDIFKGVLVEKYNENSYIGPLCLGSDIDYGREFYDALKDMLEYIGTPDGDFDNLLEYLMDICWDHFDDHIVEYLFAHWGEPLTLDDI